jgi:hypothetical protein
MSKRLIGLVAVVAVALPGAWAPSARAADMPAFGDGASAVSVQFALPSTLDRSSWG